MLASAGQYPATADAGQGYFGVAAQSGVQFASIFGEEIQDVF